MTAEAQTEDLGGNDFDTIYSQYVDLPGNSDGEAIDTFEVTPGVNLGDQTLVVSELPPSGDYASMTCFTNRMSGRKVSTFPGSLHITATVNTTGPCKDFATISNPVISLTLPAGFSFADKGKSPTAHVFVGPAGGGFDFHYPVTFTEVTSLVKQTVSGQTDTVDLSNLDLGLGKGVIPSGDTIYVRAHAVYTKSTVSPDGTPFVFTTSTTAGLAGGTSTGSESQTVVASSLCVDGNLP